MIKSPDFIRNRTYLTPFIAIHIPMGEPPALRHSHELNKF